MDHNALADDVVVENNRVDLLQPMGRQALRLRPFCRAPQKCPQTPQQAIDRDRHDVADALHHQRRLDTLIAIIDDTVMNRVESVHVAHRVVRVLRARVNHWKLQRSWDG